MSPTRELPWLTVRHDEVVRMERLADVVDQLTADPNGLAAALRNTPTYLKALPQKGGVSSERTISSAG
jgi:hypothetical protein